MAAAKPFNLNMKLDHEKDADIIAFLADKPNAYIVKLALRRFMNESRGILSEVPTKHVGGSEEAAASDLLNGF